jgi:2-octaprenyl-6-methoxyphenol hydroxylase
MPVDPANPASVASPIGDPLSRKGGWGDSALACGSTAYDGDRKVAIIGGGPAGLALALALHRHGIAAEVFEARNRKAVRKDPRVLALSEGSRQILSWIGAWPAAAATPIRIIHVSQRGGFGRTRLHAEEVGVEALGWVLAAADLIPALESALDVAGIVYHEGAKVGAGDTANFALTACAEGAVDAGAGERRDYGQAAVLCEVDTEAPHANVAWERFTDEGPLALLPLGRRYAVVMTCDEQRVAETLALPDEAFLAALQGRFGDRHRFCAATPRVAYPLGLRYRREPVGERRVWLGNAAQTLHPVAGQGFNLALRDVWELARTVAGSADPGAPELLAAYAAGRRFDRRGAIAFTDLLIDSFGNDFPPLRHARGAGLLALDLLPAVRSFVARRMIFGARAWP